MAEIQILTRAFTCWCQGSNTMVGWVCPECSGSVRVYRTTHRIIPPLPIVSTTCWARFKRFVGFEHPLELQEWLRDMEARLCGNSASDEWMVFYGEPGKGKTYASKPS